jgi:hypothetical protein
VGQSVSNNCNGARFFSGEVAYIFEKAVYLNLTWFQALDRQNGPAGKKGKLSI